MPELVSSTEHLTGEGKKQRFDLTNQAWHAESWKLYNQVGEYKSAVNWIANALSEFIIVPKRWSSDGLWIDEDDDRALGVVGLLGNQGELYKTWGVNSVVTGEVVLVEVGGRWMLRSRNSVQARTTGQFYLDDYGTGVSGQASKQRYPLITDAWRLFLPHGEKAMLADTPPAAFLNDLEQLRLLRLVLNSKLNTRLWMNGVWVFGQKVSLPTQNGKNTPGRQSAFLTQLRTLVTTNMRRRDDASDVSPIFMQVATPEVGDVVKQYYPEVAIDAREAGLRKEIRLTLRELLDLPVEVQTSMSNTNHWGSWSITEMNLIYCLIPRAKALLNAIGLGWYRERLIEAGLTAEEAAIRCLVPDASNLIGEPSSDEVRQAYDRIGVTGSYMRKSARIPEDAVPEGDEAVRIVGWKVQDPYLMLWGTPEWDKIDWMMVGAKKGAPGTGVPDPQSGPGVGDPGAPPSKDENSEVGGG